MPSTFKSIKIRLLSRFKYLRQQDMLSTVLARNIKKYAFTRDFVALIRKRAAKH
jgi:hypothetical protein